MRQAGRSLPTPDINNAVVKSGCPGTRKCSVNNRWMMASVVMYLLAGVRGVM